MEGFSYARHPRAEQCDHTGPLPPACCELFSGCGCELLLGLAALVYTNLKSSLFMGVWGPALLEGTEQEWQR